MEARLLRRHLISYIFCRDAYRFKSERDADAFEQWIIIFLVLANRTREAHAIVVRFGLDGLGSKTLEETAKYIGVGKNNHRPPPISRAQVRNVLNRGFSHLRHFNGDFLRKFIEEYDEIRD